MSDPNGLVVRRNLARRLFASRIKKYVAVSMDLYGWLKEKVRIPQNKLVLIPNGVDTRRFRPARDSRMRAELGIAEDEFVVGTVGRLDPIKNYEGLINALRIINSGTQKARLIIVGDGPSRTAIQSALMQASLQPPPLMLGYRADVERIYNILDTFVLNSFAEGLSHALLEAMASGLPVVCTSIGGNIELVTERQRGLLVESADDAMLAEAIREYMNSPHTRYMCGANACRFVQQYFSSQQMVDRYFQLYESIA
jgi:glycosyltransferase involved in cell wall biosynthesis